jgi:hypothetical protein
MRDAKAVLRDRMTRHGWTLREVAARTSPPITHEALRLFLDGESCGWKVATAVGNLLGWRADRVLRSVALYDQSDGASGGAK